MYRLFISGFVAIVFAQNAFTQNSPPGIVIPDLSQPPLPLPPGIQGQPQRTMPPPQPAPPAQGPGSAKENLTPQGMIADIKLPSSEKRVKLDRGSVMVRNTSSGWVLLGGQATVVRNFGDDRQSAEDAAKAIRELAPNEWATIGTVRPVVGYAITDQKLNLTVVPSKAAPIDLTSVRAEQIRGVWVLRDASSLLLNFGLEKDGADQAAAVVRKYGFNRVGYVGRANMEPSFSYFYAISDSNAMPAPSHTQNASSSMMQQLSFAQQEQQMTRTGIPIPGLGLQGERIAIETKKLETRRDGADWVLAYGPETLARFGNSEWSARDALRTLQDMHVTEFCRVGPSGFSFVLVNGKPPTNVPFNAQGLRFDTKALVARPIDGKYGVFEGSGRMVFTASNKAEAEQIVKVVQGFGFDQQCQIGQSPQASIKFLAKTR